ncbi:hypothetical protein JCM3775_004615 [Rhodotorula graminis]
MTSTPRHQLRELGSDDVGVGSSALASHGASRELGHEPQLRTTLGGRRAIGLQAGGEVGASTSRGRDRSHELDSAQLSLERTTGGEMAGVWDESSGSVPTAPFGAPVVLIQHRGAVSSPQVALAEAPSSTPVYKPAFNKTAYSGSGSSTSATASASRGAGDAPHRPVERMSRLSSFAHRLSSHSRDTSPSSSSPRPADDSFPRRPRFPRRFSRSLTSLQASLHVTCDGPQDALEPSPSDEPDEGSKLARWRAKGKAKLVAAFKPPTLESPPTSPPSASSPFATSSRTPELGRAPSRSRSYSAPPFLPRAPAAPLEQSQVVAPVAADPPPLAGLASPASPGPLFPLGASYIDGRDSPALDAFATCPSSPIGDADPFSSSSPPSLARAAVRPARRATTFDNLPREVQLGVFAALVEACEDEWRRDVREGRWVGKKASERWSDGRARGKREVIKLGRVSRAWRALSLDGQLWATAPASSVLGGDVFTQAGVAALLESAGDFLTTLDAKGMGDTLGNPALEPLLQGTPTRLAKIDLTGCTAVTSFALTRLITFSPDLVELVVPGLPCVTGEHLRALAMHCPRLAKLDVSRCPDLTAHWLFSLPYPPPRSADSRASSIEPSIELSKRRGLKSLKASGLAGMDLVDVGLLLHWHPHLVTLDLSFSVGLDDSVLERLVVRPQPPVLARPSHVDGGARLAYVPAPVTKQSYPALRHLNLSACKRISSVGLHHLVGACPNLEVLELSRIGAGLRTDGLARFLASCTKLRKLDLEDATETTDEALLALVPSTVGGVVTSGAPSLTHLVIANCRSFTDGAISAVALAGGCTELRVLEADGTAISDRTAKAFVRLAAPRALAAQVAALARLGDRDPLVASKHPALLSVLDDRTAARRMSRDVGWASMLRPRNGQRGPWTSAVESYHDREPHDMRREGDRDESLPERDRRAKGVIDECDPARVVVRSFYSHLAVDAARVTRDAAVALEREKAAAANSRGSCAGSASAAAPARESLLRSRALSDSHILRPSRLLDDEDGRAACVIS